MAVSNAGMAPPARRRRSRRNFVQKTIAGLATAMEQTQRADELAEQRGLLQQLDPRVKVIGLLALVVAAALSRSMLVIGVLFGIALGLAILSRIPIRVLATRLWIGMLLFTGTLAFPAIFLTPGVPLTHVPLLGWPITEQGLRSVLYLITRVETATTFSVLLILCTPWNKVLKAMSVLGVPAVFVVILGMTYRYIFLMLQTAQAMFESRQSRMVGRLVDVDRRRLAAASVGVLLAKTFQLSNDIYLSMQSRGFRGHVYTLDEFQMRRNDWIAMGMFSAIAAIAIWAGR